MTVAELQEIEFVLSPFYELPNAEDVIDVDEIEEENMEEINKVRAKELYFLSSRGSFFLINPTIHAFLSAFKEAKTIKQVTNEFAKLSNCKPVQIEDAMINFLREMGRKGILLTTENAADAIAYKEEGDSKSNQWFQVGDKIGVCEVIEPLSIRGATQLYVCKHPDEEKDVVVKTMVHSDLIPEKVRLRNFKKFRQEFHFMEELGKHPNICNLIELNTEGDFHFAVIEKIDGKSLRSFIKNEETSIETKLDIIHQMLETITHVQGHEIIHGDLHLSNFIVTEEKQIKLIDFGLSNHKDLQEEEIIRNGGVHECVPPERVKVKGFSTFKKRGNYRSEVFQLGVLIYFILYKKYPFSGFTWAKLAQSIQEDILEYSKSTKDGQDIPENMLELLRIAMEKNPENRFENAEKMLAFFENKL